MRLLIISIFILLLYSKTYTQIPLKDKHALRNLLDTAKDDSTRQSAIIRLAAGYRFSNVDSALYFIDQALAYAKKIKSPVLEANMLSLKGATLLENGRLPESLEYQFQTLKISTSIKDTVFQAFALNRIGNTYMELADYKKANEYYFRSMDLFSRVEDTGMVYNEMSNIGNVYELMGIADSALYYQQFVLEATRNSDDRVKVTRSELMFRLGNAYKLIRDTAKALAFYKKGIEESIIDNDLRNQTMNSLLLSSLFMDMGLPDSSRLFANNALQTASAMPFSKGIYESTLLLSQYFNKINRYDSAYHYLLIANAEKENLSGLERYRELQHILLDEQERQRESEAKRILIQNRQKQFAFLAGFGIMMIIAVILYRNNVQKQKANKVLETTLAHLKSTQSQLVQSEKMASLGELTAGIAHEIQNPLNFVNNFSEVNNELIAELKEEINKGNIKEVMSLANVVAENEQKITHHGKRADAIVKGMLLHSRSNSGQKEPTEINALADEYLRLAYHGLRAKDKSFNATMKTDFDESIGNINIIPQDIGRVILNLITNAFYAVDEKKKQSQSELVEDYKPTVFVSTKKVDDKVEIKVADNGNGIPKKLLDKIFQPFFTTKPTGMGTGLGLSLSYDIVKAHGGEIKLETNEGEGSEFIIQLTVA